MEGRDINLSASGLPELDHVLLIHPPHHRQCQMLQLCLCRGHPCRDCDMEKQGQLFGTCEYFATKQKELYYVY